MIAVSTSGRAFAGLAHYLVHGRTGREHDRVAWMATRNLPVQDPERAARFMQATAAQNHSVKQPVYHLVVSFDPADHPTSAIMRQVADRLLANLKLAEHEALVVAHKDRAHAHLHIVVNRVHPGTHRGWNPWQDYVATQLTLRELETSLGLRQVKGRLHPLPDPVAAEQRQPLQQPEPASPNPTFTPERRPIIADAIARIRELGVAHQLRDMRHAVEQRLFALNAKLSAIREAHGRAIDASRAFDQALTKAYIEPRIARLAFQELIKTSPDTMRQEARRTMAEDPKFFGKLRTEKRPILFGLFHRRDESAARAHAKDAAQLGVRASLASKHLHKTLEDQGAPVSRQVVETYTRVVTDLEARLDLAKRDLNRIDGARRVLLDDRTLQRTAAAALQYVLPEELHHVARALTGPQLNLIGSLRAMTADLTLGRERHVG